VLNGVFVQLPDKISRIIIIPAFVEFLDEQKVTDEEAKNPRLRQIIKDENLPKQAKIMHLSEFDVVPAPVYDEEGYIDRMQTDAECLLTLTKTIKKVHEEKNVQGWCGTNKSYEVKQSFVDFRPLKDQLILSKILSVSNSKSLEEA